MKRPPLPKTIDFGIGIVHVHEVSKKDMRDLAEIEEPDEATPEGLCWSDEDAVYVGKWLGIKRRWEVLMHELAHYCLDWRDEDKCKP